MRACPTCSLPRAAALLAAALAVGTLVPSPVTGWISEAHAADDLAARAEQLAKLRGDVAALQGQLAERKDVLDTQLRALDAQRIDLEVQARREELRAAQVQSDLATQLARTESDAGLEDEVRPALVQGFAALRAQVSGGLPFRVAERIAALDELEAQVARGDLLPTRALGRLWAFAEDELRLTRENVLDRQVVSLPDGDVLSEVARVGMVGLYFRAPDGRVGRAVRADGSWSWEALSDAESRRQIESLFETLRKGIRTGWFELPWAFGEVSP